MTGLRQAFAAEVDRLISRETAKMEVNGHTGTDTLHKIHRLIDKSSYIDTQLSYTTPHSHAHITHAHPYVHNHRLSVSDSVHCVPIFNTNIKRGLCD